MALALALGGAASAALQGCDPHGAGDANGDGGAVDGTDGSCNGGGGDTGGGDTGAGGSGGDTAGATCNFVPEQGPALLDFGRCETMATGEILGACGNTGVHRRCDAAFLAWCNEQGGDVTACDEDQVFDAQPTALCGTGPNAIACDLPFRDNCDSLDGTFVSYDDEDSVGACLFVLRAVAGCCDGQEKNSEGIVVFTGCTTKAGLLANSFYNKCSKYKFMCENVACNSDGQCKCK